MTKIKHKLILGLTLLLVSAVFIATGTVMLSAEPSIGFVGSFLACSGVLLIMLWELENRELIHEKPALSKKNKK